MPKRKKTANADNTKPKRLSRPKVVDEAVAERREHVWRFIARRVPQTVMAKLLNVSRDVIAEDVAWWKARCQENIEKIKKDMQSANAEIGMTAMRLESISQAALNDYELAKSDTAKNLYLNTAIKAERTRTDVLIETGILPKPSDDVRITHEINASFTARLGEKSALSALDDPSSRRKVLTAAEKILRLGASNLDTIDVIDVTKSSNAPESTDSSDEPIAILPDQ